MSKKQKICFEELLNSGTHYFGALLSISGLVILIIHSANTGNISYVISSVIFGLALIFLYSMSGTYHLVIDKKLKEVFKKLDHIAIYILIAASYTPYIFTVLTGKMKWIVFSIQWGLVILGTIFKIFYAGRFSILSTLVYILMGWTAVIVFKDIKVALSPLSFNLLVAGGITYTVGALVYSLDKLKFNHPVWHLFVLGGSACHYFSILFIY